MAQLLINPKHQFFDSNGDPLSGGKVYFYEAGTSTPTDTFTDQGGGTANANPVILDAAGRAEIWLDPAQSYKVQLDDSDDNNIWTVDDIDYLPDLIVTTAKLNNLAVTTAKIADSAVTTAKINDLAVTTAKIFGEAVTTAKLADLAVTTAKIADGAVTADKLSNTNIGISSSDSGTFSTSSTTEVDITNVTDSITTNGRPVFVGLQCGDGASNPGVLQVSHANPQALAYVYLYRGSTRIAQVPLQTWCTDGTDGANLNRVTIPPGTVWHIDQPAAGTYTYKATMRVTNASYTALAQYIDLVLVEL